MSRAISQAVAPGGVPCSPAGSVGSEPRSRHPSALVSLVAALSSLLGGGFSLWAVPPTLLLGASGLFHAAPAQAQTTLVSNIGQAERDTAWSFSLRSVLSQGFTTGSNASGYTLSSIEAVLLAVNADIRAELWSDADGSPNLKIADLTFPSTAEAGTVSFAAPANTTLTASTTYHFVLYTVGSSNPRLAAILDKTTEDSGAAAG